MLALWVPLAASIVMMVLEPSTINIALGRTTNPELALAAYGVAFGLALLVEAPVLMLLDASVAKSTSRQAFAVIRRFALVLGLIVTAIGLVVALTPLYEMIVVDLMSIPTDVAARARPTMQLLVFWPLPIAWRRAHQGVLIRAQRTAIITVATGVRLVTLAVSLYAGLQFLPEGGAVVAGLAMDISVTVEAVLITIATGRVLRSGTLERVVGESDDPPLAVQPLWRFYRPLAVTTILRQSTRPLLNAGIAAAVLARASLAAWPVVWGFTVLVAGPAWSLQQLSTALVINKVAYQRVRNFALSLSVVMTLILGAVAFTPLYPVVMGGIYNLSAPLQELALPAMRIMVIYPLIMGGQGLLRGVLIRYGCTGDVRTAMAINVITVGATLLLGVVVTSMPGTTLAALATLTGGVAEFAWLRWKTQT
jgi:hypothetical protein